MLLTVYNQWTLEMTLNGIKLSHIIIVNPTREINSQQKKANASQNLLVIYIFSSRRNRTHRTMTWYTENSIQF